MKHKQSDYTIVGEHASDVEESRNTASKGLEEGDKQNSNPDSSSVNTDRVALLRDIKNTKMTFTCVAHRLLMNFIFYIPMIALILAGIYLYVIKHIRYDFCEQVEYTEGILPSSFGRSSSDCKLLHSDEGVKSDPTMHRILLLGDSLINKPNRDFHIVSSIQTRISTRYPSLNFTVEYVFFSHIKNLQAMMCDNLAIIQAESVILYWDSDVESLSVKDIVRYTHTLADVISTLKQGVKHVAFAGPGLIGEAPVGDNKMDQCADTYREIHKNISTIYNVSYIDIRKVFIEADRRKGWTNACCYLTLDDGHHPSKLGAQIEMGLFYDQLEQWYSYDEH